jgi:hypothetical protein
MSAFPLVADTPLRPGDVCFVPQADLWTAIDLTKSRNPMNAWGLPDAGIQATMFLPACAGSCLERQ